MKVLWFTNTPCGATEFLTGEPVTGGGWLYALSEQLAKEPNIELHIAFYWGKCRDAFVYNGIYYHPILREDDKNKWTRMIGRYKNAYRRNLPGTTCSRFIPVINSILPDIIHIHGSEEDFGFIAEEKLSCPLVLSIQGLLSPYYYKLYAGYGKKEISQHEGIMKKLIASGISITDRRMRRRAEDERLFLHLIPNIIGRTFWDRACSLAMNPSRRYFEVDEILRPEFYAVQWKKTTFNSPICIISTISNGIYKGIETIFHTARVLNDAGVSFVWKVIGISSDNLLVQLAQKQVKQSSTELHIDLLGKKDAHQMISLMQQADLFVQTSHIENSPNSLCEAMLIGMPIIATFAGGTASMLENNEEGRLVQDGDPYILAGVIMEMSSNFDSAKNMGRRASERAKIRHAPERVCKQLYDVYLAIINR